MYDHKALEEKWRKRWEESRVHEVSDQVEGKENEYFLVEFPYPSGDLHIGHWYAFAVPDIYARFRRMQGKNVLFPIGFDAFGLPAENAAIKRGLDPKKWTYGNIETMTEQLRQMGNSFDWTRMVRTCDPEYYRWTQWLFLKLYEKGLAYKKKSEVPWCDSCKTVLANEQIVHGACERCGTAVVQKELDQWFFKITAYAERLLADLDTLPWAEEIKQAQREWIGCSKGAEIPFGIVSAPLLPSIKVFTTRPDTLFGVTYVVLAPEHPLVSELKEHIENWDEVSAYRELTATKKELERKEGKEKTGVPLKGVFVKNPANGEEVPVWVADYVLANYGTGAVMAVPAHDERDFEFAQKYKLEIREVIEIPDEENNLYKKITYGGGNGIVPWFPSVYQITNKGDGKIVGFLYENLSEHCYTEYGILKDSSEFSGMSSEEAKHAITERFGKATTQYRLRDWLLSRQRFWGCPIPVVYDPDGTPHPVPEEHLPWLLPEDADYTPTGDAPLASSQELRERTERLFGKGWKPEVDTMDTFVDSSWYFLRYTDPHNEKEFASKEKQDAWLPVTRYSGGAEHVTMHLLYSRFFHKALFDLGLVHDAEPYGERMNRGLILGPDGRKMSKSKGNVINPSEHVARVGADVVKMYLAFIGPYNEVGQYPWDLGGIAGIRRFLERVWQMQEKIGDGEIKKEFATLLHKTIKRVSDDLPAFKTNTAVSALMVFVNALEKEPVVPRGVFETFLRLLAPFAPFFVEEMWEKTGHTTSVHKEAWPSYDEKVLDAEEVIIVLQVNGKTRSTLSLPRGVSQDEVSRLAQKDETVARHLGDVSIKKEIFVPDRLWNAVV